MPDEGERQWIVEPPPAAGEVAVYVAFGDGRELSAEQEAALSALLQSLENAEVAGFADTSDCSPLQCTKVTCSGLLCIRLTKGVKATAAGWNLMGSFGTRL